MWSRITLITALLLACVPDRTVAPFQASTTFTVQAVFHPNTGCLTGYWCGLPYAEVTSTCGNGRTNSLGKLTLVCSGSTISGTVKLRNGRVRVVRANGGSTDQTFSGSGGGTITVTMPDTAAHFFLVLYEWDSLATARFGMALNTEVVAQPMPEDQIPGTCGLPPGVVGCYLEVPYARIIFTDLGYTTGLNSTAAHELGHAFLERAIEDTYCYANDPECPVWLEGFADFFMAFVNDETTDGWIENVYGSSPQGVAARTRIAAFLNDAVDSSGSYDGIPGDDDTLVWPASYLAQLIRTCRTRIIITWADLVSAVDQVIVCMQRNATARNAAPSWDQPKWLPINSFTEDATEPSGWTSAKVQKLWLYNLYDQGSLP